MEGGLLAANAEAPPLAVNQAGVICSACAERNVFAGESFNPVVVAFDLLGAFANHSGAIVSLYRNVLVCFVTTSGHLAALLEDSLEETDAGGHSPVTSLEVG